MNDTRDALIASLAADAQPVERPGRTGRMALAWLAAAAVLAIAGLLLHAPATVFRGPLLLTSPQFLLESALGAAALICAGMAAFRAGIPAPPSRRAVWLPLLPLLAWLALHVAELWFPTFEASMAGKRAHCWLEVLVVGVPGLVLGGYLVRRPSPSRSRTSPRPKVSPSHRCTSASTAASSTPSTSAASPPSRSSRSPRAAPGAPGRRPLPRPIRPPRAAPSAACCWPVPVPA
jgi:hypothetical protein